MATPADSGTKKLISLSPSAWARWVSGRDDIIAENPLDHEFQWVTRRSDALIPCTSASTGPFLMPTELLLRYNSNVSRRMRAYAALAEEKYNLPTYPVLLVMLPPGDDTEIPDRFEQLFPDKLAVQEYRVVKLCEMDVDVVFTVGLRERRPSGPRDGGQHQNRRDVVYLRVLSSGASQGLNGQL